MLRLALLAFFLLGTLNALASPAVAADSPPNIVFILVDDLRWDALSCAGHPFVKTPHIDRLAKEGALFRNAFVTLPLCSPSRGCFLTGQYAHTHGVIDNTNHAPLSHKLVTFPRLLHDAGYETAYVGKWHMGNDDSPRPGFDRWVSFKGQGQYDNPPINVDGQASKVDGYMTDILNNHAVDFLRQPRSKPFALYLAHKAVHGPFTPAERHKDLYATDERKLPPSLSDDLSGKPILTRKLDNAPKKNQKKQAQAPAAGRQGDGTMRQQLRGLMSIDDGVGRILAALEETKQLDNTLVVFTSDNGFFWGEHKLGDKRAAYEESIRIPLVMRCPKFIKPGTTVDQLVLNIDIAPTFLEAAAVSIPKTVQGRSLLPLLKGNTDGWRTAFLAEYFLELQFNHIPTWQAVRTDRWKYIRYPDLEAMDELYDLKSDPYELKNLLTDPDSQPQLADLKQQLDHLLSNTGAKQK